MTTKEKAKDLVDKFANFQVYTIGFNPDEFVRLQRAKQCALIAVDEILNEKEYGSDPYYQREKYWKEVKQEIDKL